MAIGCVMEAVSWRALRWGHSDNAGNMEAWVLHGARRGGWISDAVDELNLVLQGEDGRVDVESQSWLTVCFCNTKQYAHFYP